MNPFLTGFTDELLKLGAYAQQHQEDAPYDVGGPVQSAMNKFHGPEAKVGLKSGPLQTKPVTRKEAPSPLTSVSTQEKQAL